MPQKLIIDADPGIGDALAIAIALADPELDVIALTAVGGAVSAVQAGRNLQALVEAIDPPKWPRIGQAEASQRMHDAESSISSPEWQNQLRSLNGPDGLGDWSVAVADLHHPRDAAKLMTELAREYPDEITVLTLGPLSNVALAADLDAGFLSNLGSLVCLAGTIASEGDVTAAAEFNVYHHPEAARVVLKSPTMKCIVSRDVSHRAILTFDQLDRLGLSEATRSCALLRQLLPFALRAHRQHLGVEGIWLPELTALAAVSRPRLFKRSPLSVDVETEGHLTRGMTVFDRRQRPAWHNNVDALVDVDAQGVLDYLVQMLRRAC
ncbi:nucleoside hydrolase [Schlesneria paludicola]|uniref:nucleoside hydrolase n=1 Tax=Schlesneria paludicola TaxID=360056 RepID=UPI00029B49A1|nr:nucleoside hydrolase [Schlesneria paludicola]